MFVLCTLLPAVTLKNCEFPSAVYLCVLHDTEDRWCLFVQLELLVLCDENTVWFLCGTNRFMDYYQNVRRPKSITTPPNDIFVTLYTVRYLGNFVLIIFEKIPSINYTTRELRLLPYEYSTNSSLHVSHFSPIFPLPHSLHTGTAL
jgi:hypothetical protein